MAGRRAAPRFGAALTVPLLRLRAVDEAGIDSGACGLTGLASADPDPNLPENTLIEIVRFPTVLRSALMSSGLKTIGEVRATSNADLLLIPDPGNESVRYLRKMVGPTNE
jgi:hypothetical protein